ncbi:lipoyl(octanoyl) transferase LipB [Vallitalea okinawensis]|uniref:lipoyl(octanoyl) transferase LipB n=1 Tax=Vallitalea okinawensis TaxID=2078660 RepID=UPI000CFE1CBB|nr:lipoyl(octanoyl) transferase LipB [Vallitalea okinawensis]
MNLNVLNLGRCPYNKALEIQWETLKKRQDNRIDDTLILVEHPPVITLGRQADRSHIIGAKNMLENNGIKIFEANRGGDVTYHGPGQIVGYPIFNLRESKRTLRQFVENLEEVFITLLSDKYNMSAYRNPKHTGVWVGDSKITAIGLAVKRGVTMHGFAFNVSTNLNHFDFIIPCGIRDKGVTSVENLIGKKVDFDEEYKSVLEYFCKVFKCDYHEKNFSIQK